MQNVIYLIFLILAFELSAQDKSSQAKRKVYRTQTGSIIEAPQPLFERARKKASNNRTKSEVAVPKVLKRTERIETTYRNELESKIPYKFYFSNNSEFIYHESWVKHNYNLFIKYHSFIPQ